MEALCLTKKLLSKITKGLILMKKRRLLRSLLCGIVLLGSIGGFVSVANAATVSLNVTASNVAGVTSKDPYSVMVSKTDAEQNFYIKLTSLTNGPSMGFMSFNSAHEQVSWTLTIYSSELNQTKSHAYDVETALQGASYYVYAMAPYGYANVHGVGNYCP